MMWRTPRADAEMISSSNEICPHIAKPSYALLAPAHAARLQSFLSPFCAEAGLCGARGSVTRTPSRDEILRGEWGTCLTALCRECGTLPADRTG